MRGREGKRARALTLRARSGAVDCTNLDGAGKKANFEPRMPMLQPLQCGGTGPLAMAEGPELSLRRHHEEGDSYRAELWRGKNLRVIACRNHIQWIIQKKGGSRDGRTRWRSIAFCATRRGLQRFLPQSDAAEVAALLDWVSQQPPHFSTQSTHVRGARTRSGLTGRDIPCSRLAGG